MPSLRTYVRKYVPYTFMCDVDLLCWSIGCLLVYRVFLGVVVVFGIYRRFTAVILVTAWMPVRYTLGVLVL